MKRNIEDYGNKLQIVGLLLGNGEETDLILMPEQEPLHPSDDVNVLKPTVEQLTEIFYQLDNLNITNSQKIVLRKSQRVIDQNVSWNVFRRDGYKCVYCGKDYVPLTVDHLVLWQDMGNTTENNLVSSCKKCNTTRGTKSIPDFLESSYYKALNNPMRVPAGLLIAQYNLAQTLPKRKPRSR